KPLALPIAVRRKVRSPALELFLLFGRKRVKVIPGVTESLGRSLVVAAAPEFWLRTGQVPVQRITPSVNHGCLLKVPDTQANRATRLKRAGRGPDDSSAHSGHFSWFPIFRRGQPPAR